jgi:hypothetical protein
LEEVTPIVIGNTYNWATYIEGISDAGNYANSPDKNCGLFPLLLEISTGKVVYKSRSKNTKPGNQRAINKKFSRIIVSNHGQK